MTNLNEYKKTKRTTTANCVIEKFDFETIWCFKIMFLIELLGFLKDDLQYKLICFLLLFLSHLPQIY